MLKVLSVAEFVEALLVLSVLVLMRVTTTTTTVVVVVVVCPLSDRLQVLSEVRRAFVLSQSCISRLCLLQLSVFVLVVSSTRMTTGWWARVVEDD